MFKKLITTIMILFTTASFAADILLVKAGSKNGTSAQRNNIYAEVLKKMGYNVKLTDAMHNKLAAKTYVNAEGPALLLWNASRAGETLVDFTENEFMAIEYSGLLYICTVNEGVSKTDGVVAIGRNNPTGPAEDMGYKNFVPYKSSSDVTNAGIAGEVDFVYVNMGGYTKMTELGKTCDVIPGLNQTAYVIGRNVNTDEMRKAIRQVIESPEMKNWQVKKGFTNENATFDYVTDHNFVRNEMSIWASVRQQ
jgi:hypothetical protein